MLPLRIVVRSSTDWERMDRSRFLAQNDPTLPLNWIKSAAKRDIFEVWNRAFQVDFFEYRGSVQRIARETFRSAQPTAMSFGLVGWESWFEAPGDEIVALTDDDDFFSPRLAQVVEAFDEHIDIVIWPTVLVGFEQSSRRSCQVHPFVFLTSNNFAVRKSFLRRNFAPNAVLEMLSHHRLANARVAAHLTVPKWAPALPGIPMLFHSRVRFITECYSVYNVHPGSIYFLANLLKLDDPLTRLRELDLVTPVELRESVRDLEPQVRALERLLTHRRA